MTYLIIFYLRARREFLTHGFFALPLLALFTSLCCQTNAGSSKKLSKTDSNLYYSISAMLSSEYMPHTIFQIGGLFPAKCAFRGKEIFALKTSANAFTCDDAQLLTNFAELETKAKAAGDHGVIIFLGQHNFSSSELNVIERIATKAQPIAIVADLDEKGATDESKLSEIFLRLNKKVVINDTVTPIENQGGLWQIKYLLFR